MDKDLEHLRLLTIFYYISAGITALFSLFPVIHLLFGIAFLTGLFPVPPPKADEPEFPVALFGLMFTLIPLAIILTGLSFALATFLTGKFIKQRKYYLFCLIVAGINCMFFPTGTALGVFTFIVLLRDSVKGIFQPQRS